MNDEDERVARINYCTDLVALVSKQAFPASLVRDYAMGQWVAVTRLCQANGIGTSTTGTNGDILICRDALRGLVNLSATAALGASKEI